MASAISKASEKIAENKKLDIVINKEACFYHSPDMDITNLVVTEMDKTFENEQKSRSTSENTPEKPADEVVENITE